MTRTPNLNTLKMFDAAARHLTFRHAAEELNLTQGAVAQQVRRLETDLGHALFHRHARGLTLTTAGQQYHPPVRRALAMLQEATLALTSDTGEVTLSVPPSFASKWLVPRLRDLAGKRPDIRLRVQADERLANLHNGEVTLAVRQGKRPQDTGLTTTLLAALDLCAVITPEHPSAKTPFADIQDFARHPLVQDNHRYWDHLLGDLTLTAQGSVTRFNQTALAMDAAIGGQGIALVPRLYLRDALARGDLISLWDAPAPPDTGFFLLHSTNAPASTRAVADWMLACHARDKRKPVKNTPTH